MRIAGGCLRLRSVAIVKEGFRQSMAWLHTWVGLLFGWLLFAIFLTGTLSYFKDEITQWMQPEIPVRALDAGASVQRAQDYLQSHAAGATRWFISLPDERTPGLAVKASRANATTSCASCSTRKPAARCRHATRAAVISSTVFTINCRCLILDRKSVV